MARAKARSAAGPPKLAQAEPNRRHQPVQDERRPEEHAPVLAQIKANGRIRFLWAQQGQNGRSPGRPGPGFLADVKRALCGKLIFWSCDD